MSAASTQYVRLPGVGHELGSYTRLYRGDDHLLQVNSITFNERYKRFYFRDIQAFIVVRTPWGTIWLVLYIVVGLLLGGIAASVGDIPGLVLGFVALLLFVWALISGLRGASCRCYVRTAVQTEKLSSLNRLRRAEKIIASLKPLIEATQGAMPETAVAAAAMEPPIATATVPPPEASSP
jgi:hypothetical protein